jgi:nitrogen regulatory protein PII
MNRQIEEATSATCLRTGNPPSLAKIELFVQPTKLDDLREELADWATALAWSEVNYHLDERRVVGVYRGSEYAVDSAPMIKVEAFVPSRVVGRVMAAIERILPPASMRRQVFAVMSSADLANSWTEVESGASELNGAH